MHEAGLAAAIAAAIRDRGSAGQPVRILVTGGHDAPEAFDAALSFHLASALPEMDPALIQIVHQPSEHWCTRCGRAFAAGWEEPCPRCGGAGLPGRMDESIEIERAAGGEPSDPRIGDRGPSVVEGPAAQAGDMEGYGLDATADAGLVRPDAKVT